MIFSNIKSILSAAEASATPSNSASPETSVIANASPQNVADALQKWQENTFDLGFVGTIVFAALVAGITFLIVKLLQRYAKRHLSGNLIIFYRLIYTIIIIVAVVMVLMTIKPLQQVSTAILASSGIAAAVLSLAAQQTLANVFSGIAISISKPFVIGEFIEILQTTPPVMGIVEDINLRQTTIRDASNKAIVIPNSVLDKEILRTTKSLQGINVCNFLTVGVSYNTDLQSACKVLSETCAAHPSVLDTRTEQDKKDGVPVVIIRVTDFGDSAIMLRASVWTKDASIGFVTLCDLRVSVKEAFDKAGIEIPYPYRNIVMKQK